MRTGLSKVTFGLLVLRVFSKEFQPIGILFVVSAMVNLLLTLYERKRNEIVLIEEPSTTFITNGDFVALFALLDITAFIALLVFLNNLNT